jgi:release factor glutamine methyltransferase
MNTPLLSDLTTQLTPISDTPALDASVLIAHVIKKPRTWVMAHPELVLTAEQQEELDDSLTRLEQGESFPYVLGQWEFFGLDFEITPDVLIPRPETELLVEKAIAWLQRSPRSRRVADIGTGSGAIAVSIAINVSTAQVLGTDISRKALDVARRNAVRFEVDHRIDFLQCDLLPQHGASVPTEKRFDLICANLPYIPTQTLHELPIYGREPTLALDGGDDGLDLFRRLLNIAPEWLAAGGRMLLEIEATHGDPALQLARRVFPLASLELHKDLTGRERLLQIST